MHLRYKYSLTCPLLYSILLSWLCHHDPDPQACNINAKLYTYTCTHLLYLECVEHWAVMKLVCDATVSWKIHWPENTQGKKSPATFSSLSERLFSGLDSLLHTGTLVFVWVWWYRGSGDKSLKNTMCFWISEYCQPFSKYPLGIFIWRPLFFSFTGTIPNVTQTVGPFIPSCIITSGPRKRIKGQWNDRLRLWNKLSSQRQTVATFKISLSAPTVITSHLCSGKVKLPQQDVCVEYCYPALAGNNIKQWVYHVTSHEPGKKIKKYTIDYTSKVMEACDWTRFRYKWKDVLAWIKKCFFGI